MSSNKTREPLTREELRTIWECNPLPVVRRLLWEIHRLRALILRTNDFMRSATRHSGEPRLDPTSKGLLEDLAPEFKEEPVVKEDERRRIVP
jgi:hypothetical protein